MNLDNLLFSFEVPRPQVHSKLEPNLAKTSNREVLRRNAAIFFNFLSYF